MPPPDTADTTSRADTRKREVPERFLVAPRTLRFDRFMTSAINIGGMGVVVAVFGIFFFIFSKTLPLFASAHVEATGSIPAAATGVPLLGVDEWNDLPFLWSGGEDLTLLRRAGPAHAEITRETVALPLPEDSQITCRKYSARNQRLLIGTADGRVSALSLNYAPSFQEDGTRTIHVKPALEQELDLENAAPVIDLDMVETEEGLVCAALQSAGEDTAPDLRVLILKRKRSLMGGGKLTLDHIDTLGSQVHGHAWKVLVGATPREILVATREGEIVYFYCGEDGIFTLRQRFRPFEEDGPALHSADFLLGRNSLVLSDTQGRIRVFSLFIPEGGDTRLFGVTREFPALGAGIDHFVAHQRNKSFLAVAGQRAMLGYATTTDVRWQDDLPFRTVSLALDAKGHNALFLDDAGTLHTYAIDDESPQAGWKAFFGKVWYEGHNRPTYEWQSTGGSDDFEPKLSMVPLLIGSLKGTFYALIFAVPIAVLAAIYTAQVLHPNAKRIVKPAMEIMASLPSVVLGFLAALWLAPLIEDKIPSILASLLLAPLAVALVGFAWSHVSVERRRFVREGSEYLWLIPVATVAAAVGWHLGPWVEQSFFTVSMPDGRTVADFRLWWPRVTGTSYDQRNCVVVGFMMGFAVVPIIFTIAEDALSNVPPSLTAASEALGATRWQVIRTVVLPIAAAGIFSALMVGFGRAVGETMIVVMATGNTPVMDPNGHLIFGSLGHGHFPLAEHWQPFNGMRTLSANLAVELPEAPENSTHYRALFLGALLLFVFTFTLNTVAEVLRHRLREKFKLV